jgi:hypothetical protein
MVQNILRNRTVLVIGAFFLTALPLIFTGIGADGDSYLVISAAEGFLRDFHYIPSRIPGYPLHELVVLGTYIPFNSIFANGMVLAVSVILLVLLNLLAEHFNMENRAYLILLAAFFPLFIVSSTSMMDYNWSVASFFAGYLLMLREKRISAAFFFSLTAGFRANNVILVVIVVAVRFFLMKEKRRDMIFIALIAASLTVVWYLPSLHLYLTGTMPIVLNNPAAQWPWWGYVVRYIYKNIYFLGLPGSLVFLFIIVWGRKEIPLLYKKHRELFLVSLSVIAAYQLLFLRFPYENEYLLPSYFFIIILITQLKLSRKILLLFAIAVISYNVFSINILKPDVPGNAQRGTPGIFPERGYTWHDIRERPVMKSFMEQKLERTFHR